MTFCLQVSGSEHRLDDILDTYDPGGTGGLDRRAWLRLVAPLLSANGHRLQMKRELKSCAILHVVLVGWVVAGGYAMSLFEASYEQDAHDVWETILARFDAGLTESQEEELSSVIETLTNKGVCSIPECDVYAEAASTENIFECEIYHSNWDFQSSVFYMFTVVSTIGYGLFTPSTWKGRLFTCLWAIPGILIFSKTLEALLALPWAFREIYMHEASSEEDGEHTDKSQKRKLRKQRRQGGKFKKREGSDAVGPPGLLQLGPARDVVERIRQDLLTVGIGKSNETNSSVPPFGDDRTSGAALPVEPPSSPRFFKREPSGALSPQGGKDPSFFVEAQKQREENARRHASFAKLGEESPYDKVKKGVDHKTSYDLSSFSMI